MPIDTKQLKADAVTSAKIADAAISLEHLDSGITPAKIVFASGRFTTVGGDATESITVTGATVDDEAFVTIRAVGGTPRTVLTAIPTANAITVTLSGDPSTDHVLSYQLLRTVS